MDVEIQEITDEDNGKDLKVNKHPAIRRPLNGQLGHNDQYHNVDDTDNRLNAGRTNILFALFQVLNQLTGHEPVEREHP